MSTSHVCWGYKLTRGQIECYQGAIRLDQYLAVAYFQQGVSNFLMGDFEEALANFNDTLLYLRGNTYIDYDQLGLKFKLYSCEVLFNRGLCYIYLQQETPGMQDFGFAQKEKMTPDHDVIDDAIKEKAVGYTVFSIPVGVVYRPNEAKVKNLKTKDYLGKARLIATSNAQNLSTGFAGAERKEALAIQMQAKDDRPAENISYAATNLVQRNLSSRVAREQSAPPVMNRNVFPPTPPPEAEKPALRNSSGSNSGSNGNALPARSTSMRNPGRGMQPPPPRMDNESPRPGMLGRAQTFDTGMGNTQPVMGRRTPMANENSWSGEESNYQGSMINRPRLGTIRTASEPRGPGSSSRATPPQPQGFSRNPSQRAAQPLYREQVQVSQNPIHRYNMMRDPAEDTVDNVFNMYANASPIEQPAPQQNFMPRQPTVRRMRNDQPYMIDEEDEYIDESYVSPEEMAAFEPVTLRGSYPKRSSSRSNRTSKRPELKRVRIKVHSPEDTRYIMMNISASMGGNGGIDFGEFESKIREKFGVKSQLKIKMREVDGELESADGLPSGDMITMGDQDDLEMLMGAVRGVAKRERSEMGKMEVWISY
jgi:tetratricopeptide (TPR) repeat protein